MADITPILDEALQKHHAHVKQFRRQSSDTRDEFLKDAYRIDAHISSLHSYLRSIRQSYLSTSPPPRRGLQNLQRGNSATSNHIVTSHHSTKNRIYFTDKQRDQIDAESKQSLRDLNSGITQLEEAEKLRQNTRLKVELERHKRRGLGALGRWAAGGSVDIPKTPEEQLESARQETIKVVRESVIWYLRKKLEEAAEIQRGMMQTRLEREVEKSKSALYKTKGIVGGVTMLEDTEVPKSNGGSYPASGDGSYASKSPAMDASARERIEQTLSPEQLQLFEQENNDMLKHYEDTLDKVRTAERSMLEISELQTTLASNLELQSVRIDQLVSQSQETEEDIMGGNKQLKRAVERKGPARWVFRATCVFCGFLILWDWFI